MYADNIILVNPSINETKKLMYVCERELQWLYMSINYTKSNCSVLDLMLNVLR